jgi:hypothetical protein
MVMRMTPVEFGVVILVAGLAYVLGYVLGRMDAEKEVKSR